MPNPTRISDLPLTNPQGGDFLPIARTTGLFPGTFKILVDQIISTLLNTANTPTINLTLNTATRTLSAEAVLIPLNRGGTGATTAPEARNNLGIGPFGTLSPPVPVLSGGTGLTTPPTNGQVLVGNNSTYTLTTLTPGSGITIQNGPGSITINSTATATVDIPIGSVMYFAASAAPAGWFECAGQTLDATIHPDLFNVIRYTYGGSGNSFRLPDLRGEFVRGWDNGRGADAGRVFGSYQKGSLAALECSSSQTAVDGVWSIAIMGNGTSGPDLTTAQNRAGYDNYTVAEYSGIKLGGTQDTGQQELPGLIGNQAWSGLTRPRNVALLACIKFANVSNLNTVGLSAQTILNQINTLQTAKAWASIWFRENNSTIPRIESSFNIGALIYRGSSANDGVTTNDNYDVLFTSPLQNNNYIVLLHGSDGQTGGYYPPSGPQISSGGGTQEGSSLGVAFVTPATTRTAGTGSLATFTSGFQLTMITTYYYPTHAYLVVF